VSPRQLPISVHSGPHFEVAVAWTHDEIGDLVAYHCDDEAA
jgi:hypothetical protein